MCSFSLLVLVSTNRMAIKLYNYKYLDYLHETKPVWDLRPGHSEGQQLPCQLTGLENFSCDGKMNKIISTLTSVQLLTGDNCDKQQQPGHRGHLIAHLLADISQDFRYLDKTELSRCWWGPSHCQHCTGQWQRVPSNDMTQWEVGATHRHRGHDGAWSNSIYRLRRL